MEVGMSCVIYLFLYCFLYYYYYYYYYLPYLLLTYHCFYCTYLLSYFCSLLSRGLVLLLSVRCLLHWDLCWSLLYRYRIHSRVPRAWAVSRVFHWGVPSSRFSSCSWHRDRVFPWYLRYSDGLFGYDGTIFIFSYSYNYESVSGRVF